MESGRCAGRRESEEKLMARFDMVAFDCDGVLVDSEPITCGVLMEMLNELGWEISLEETIRTFVGRSFRDEFHIIESRIGRPLATDFYANFLVRRDARLRELVQPVRGVQSAIEALDRLRMPFCVASGAERAKMQLTLRRTGLLRWFEGKMFSGMEVARSKPAPDVYLLAAQAMGVAPERCVVVEDTVIGVTAGVAAGMTVLGFAEYADAAALRAAGAADTFTDMAALPDLVQ
jgi:HAD superfamily hydrolase (TIGR01509 family)